MLSRQNVINHHCGRSANGIRWKHKQRIGLPKTKSGFFQALTLGHLMHWSLEHRRTANEVAHAHVWHYRAVMISCDISWILIDIQVDSVESDHNANILNILIIFCANSEMIRTRALRLRFVVGSLATSTYKSSYRNISLIFCRIWHGVPAGVAFISSLIWMQKATPPIDHFSTRPI